MSPLEIDLKRLIAKCELMVGQTQDWRLEKYVESLEDKLRSLRQMNVCQPNHDDLIAYAKKINFLKGVIVTCKLTSPSEKLIACQALSSVHHHNDNDSHSAFMANQTRDIHLQAQAKYVKEMRKELLNDGSDDDGLRRRNVDQTENHDVEALLKYQQDVQEKVAEDMVLLARNLKENCYVSNEIIKKDTETLEHAGQIANSNYESLRGNTDIISDFVKRSCQYWLWIMLGLVCITFLWIVVFIRMFPKHSQTNL